MMPDCRQLADLQTKLGSIECFNRHQLVWVPETASTSDDLKHDWKSPCFIPKIEVAELQTAGRGQYQRTWLNNEPGQCLMFSFSAQAQAGCFPPSLLAGVALCEAFAAHCTALPEKVWLKWPNDVFLGSKKLAGILTESVADGNNIRLVIGVGVNMTPLSALGVLSACVSEFAPELGRVELLLRFFQAWNALVKVSAEVVCRLWNQYAAFADGVVFRVEVTGECLFNARMLNLLPDGRLQVEDEDGRSHTLVSATLQPLTFG